jgi:hypothetical protein
MSTNPWYTRFLSVILVLGVIGTFIYHTVIYTSSGLVATTESSNLRQTEKVDVPKAPIPDAAKLLPVSNEDEWSRERLLLEVHNAAESLKQAVAKPFHSAKSKITRGIAVYFPASETQQEKELKGLLLSIAHMRSSQPESIKTDLIVFSPPRGFAFAKSIGCTVDKRTSFTDSERCVIVEHVPLSERPGVNDPLLSYKRYLDSILMLAEYKDFASYDVLMKSDMDTFVTPAFADWLLPPGKLIAVGRGGYGHPNANGRLSFIMKNTFGLTDAGRTNIGTTWYGSPSVLVAACQLSVASMRWLDRMEFTEYERLHHTTDAWPVWYWPVLTMYGGHISINQISKDKVIYQEDNVMEMDYGSDATGELRPSVKHLHCWHTDRFFSKFAFAMGKYDAMDLTDQAEMNTPSSYSAVIALSAVRLTVPEFKAITSDKTRMKNGDWKRLTA